MLDQLRLRVSSREKIEPSGEGIDVLQWCGGVYMIMQPGQDFAEKAMLMMLPL